MEDRIFRIALTILLPLGLLLYLYGGQGINGNDFWWHVKVGEYISTNHVVPRADIFSWWGIQQHISWTAHEWMADVFFYDLLTRTGERGVFLLCVGSSAGMICILRHRLSYAAKRNTIFTALFLVAVSTLSVHLFIGRPQIFNYYFLLVFLTVLYRYRENGGYIVYILVPIAALWSNLHGGSAGLSYLLCIVFLIEGCLQFRVGRIVTIRQKRQWIVRLTIVTILCIIAILINPIGIRVLIYPYQNLTDSISMSAISEWQPPDAKNISDLFFYFGPILLMVSGFVISKKDIQLIDILVMLMFLFFFFRSVRFIMLWYIAACFCGTSYIPELQIQKVKTWYQKAICWIFVIITIGFCGYGGYRVMNKCFEDDIISKVISNESIQAIRESGKQHIFNDYNIGETLIYNDIPVFFDARADLYSEPGVLSDGFALTSLVENDGKSIQDMIQDYGFDGFVILKTRPLYTYLVDQPEKYECIFENDEDNVAMFGIRGE